VAIALVFYGAGAGTGWLIATTSGRTEPAPARAVAPLLWQVWNLADAHYVDPSALNPQKLIYGAIQGMLSSLGDTDHTRFLTPADVQQENSQLAGHFVGIGIQVNLKDGRPVVVAPLPNSPAQKAGVEAGDVILDVNGHDTAQLTLTQLSADIRGPAGSAVSLMILRPKEQHTFTVMIARAAITVPAVDAHEFEVNGKSLIHIHVVQFSQQADAQLRAALQTANGDHVSGIILDLRDNPGGLLDQTIAVTSEFLTTGNVLLEQNRDGTKHPDPVKPGGLAPTTPLVVLLNQGTASAAEITAGALQDQKRGTLVGATTFGTGTVLGTYTLSDGSEVLLGTQEWLTPDGHLIWHHGITPDQVVTLPDNVSPTYPDSESGLTGAQIASGADTQLARAVTDLGG